MAYLCCDAWYRFFRSSSIKFGAIYPGIEFMPMFTLRRVFLSAVISIVFLSGCGESGERKASALNSEKGVLRFVPADTPYLIATPGDLPDELMDKLEPQLDAVLKSYHSIIRAMVENAYAEAREADADLSTFEYVLPVVDELESLMSVEGLRGLGIERNADAAIYGVGLLPVLRLELSNSDLFESAIARMEERTGRKMGVAAIGEFSYRYTAGDDESRLVIAIIENNLVVAVVPTALPDDLIKQVLGLTLPGKNIADSGRLGEIANTYRFDDYMIGIVDFERIAATFLDAQTGINAALLNLADFDDSLLSAVCKTEIRSLAGVMPKIVMGYTELSAQKMSSKMVIELRDDIAAGVSTMTGIVPGLTAPQDGLFSFGMSMDLLAARTFYSERLDAIEATPFECELFADLQEGVSAGRDVLKQPIPPVAYGFKGFLAVVEDVQGMDLARQIPPTSADMRLLVAMDNAESLIAMGAMFSPELAALKIEPDGEPVKLAMQQIDASGLDVYVAMSENGLGLSVGAGMQEGLAEMLKADAPDPSPFLVLDMDAERYYGLVSDVMVAQADNGEAIPELQAAAQAMTRSIQMLVDRLRLVVNFTKNGIEVDSEIQLSD
jgi:hypothetical protein